jgi:hypothetical protein
MSMADNYIGVQDRPQDAVMPALAQDIVTGTTAVLVVVLLGYALRRAFADRDPRWPILVLASGITVLMEPFACFMVKAHHPAVGSYVLLRGLGVTVPVQLLFFYMLYFAPTGLFLIHRARQRVPASRYWRDFAVIYLLLFGGEALAIHLGVWFFFGNNPFVVLGLPLWVALTNIAAVYAWSVAAAYCLDRLAGRRRYWALVAAPFAAIAVYAPISLPTAIALQAGGGFATTAPAAALSVVIGLLVIWGARHLLLEIESGPERALRMRLPPEPVSRPHG